MIQRGRAVYNFPLCTILASYRLLLSSRPVDTGRPLLAPSPFPPAPPPFPLPLPSPARPSDSRRSASTLFYLNQPIPGRRSRQSPSFSSVWTRFAPRGWEVRISQTRHRDIVTKRGARGFPSAPSRPPRGRKVKWKETGTQKGNELTRRLKNEDGDRARLFLRIAIAAFRMKHVVTFLFFLLRIYFIYR